MSRSEIFYTTKLRTNKSYEATLADLKKSLKTCKLEYIDLYLLHSPIGGPLKRKECWRACIEGKKLGLTRSIGVSNFGKAHIQEFIDQEIQLPVLNQIDLHPFMRHNDITAICEKAGIVLEVSRVLMRSPTHKPGLGSARPWHALRPPRNQKGSQSSRQVTSADLDPLESPTR